MKREDFVKVVEESLDSLPQEFRSRIRNVAVMVEDIPPNQPSPQSGQQRRLLLGLFHGVPTPPRRPYLTYLRGPITSCVTLTAKELRREDDLQLRAARTHPTHADRVKCPLLETPGAAVAPGAQLRAAS